jgi:hypothetical protein
MNAAHEGHPASRRDDSGEHLLEYVTISSSGQRIAQLADESTGKDAPESLLIDGDLFHPVTLGRGAYVGPYVLEMSN